MAKNQAAASTHTNNFFAPGALYFTKQGMYDEADRPPPRDGKYSGNAMGPVPAAKNGQKVHRDFDREGATWI
ncbi:hypothetical protein [Bacillus sp. REN3]|uniref:hypothetical protein n=1 Tax=Bacillus sp. REN3 TaxID=2802440 RepID=UPI001AEF30A8|nr:hypothetical protein [Bacillus sp. REN3]